MSMTFLALSQRLLQECGGSGIGPTSVSNQSGEQKRIVDWISTADEDVQRLRNDWLFMRSGFTVNTVSGTAAYAHGDCTDTTSGVPIAAFRDWDKDTFKIYLAASGVAGERPMDYLDYASWYAIHNTGTQTASFPTNFTVLSNRAFSLGPKPDGVYVVTGEYQKSVTTMTANTDVPVYPSEYHMLPLYLAMMSYGVYAGATEIYQAGSNKYKKMLAEMERTQLPEMQLGGAWA